LTTKNPTGTVIGALDASRLDSPAWPSCTPRSFLGGVALHF
jgi:hypothetical protein